MSKNKNTQKKVIGNRAMTHRHRGSVNADALCSLLDEKNGDKASIALRFHDTLLRHSDVQLLQGAHAINNRLISFYYAHLQTRVYKMDPDLHFLTPAQTYIMRYMEKRDRQRLARELQLASKQFVFVPLLDQSHWSLLLVSRPDRKFFYFDSEDNRHLILAQLLHQFLRIPLEAEDYVFTPGRCLQQGKDKAHQSGIHLMCMTDNMADYVSRCGFATSTLLVSVQEVRGKRVYLQQLIRTLGGITPISSSN